MSTNPKTTEPLLGNLRTYHGSYSSYEAFQRLQENYCACCREILVATAGLIEVDELE